MTEPKTMDEFRARLYKVCKYLEKKGIVPEGSCERLQALPPTLLPAPVPGVPPPAAPPARFAPAKPGAAQLPVAPTPPAGFDPATLLPGVDQIPTAPRADQIPAAPRADQIPTEPELPPPGVSPPPSLPITGPKLPTPAKGSLLVYPQRLPQSTSGAGYFTGVRPGTYAYPSSIQVDGKGRIVSIVPGAAPETSDLCLTSYLVSTNSAGAPYTSIQEAYDAAVAAGHGIDNPAQVLVCPGDYTEDLNLTTAGIDVIAIAIDSRQPSSTGVWPGRGLTRVLGDVTIQLGAESTVERTTMAWRGIDVVAGTTRAMGVVGAAVAQFIYISDCLLIAGSAERQALIFEGASSFVDVQRCALITGATGWATINQDSGTMRLFGCGISARPIANQTAVLVDSGNMVFEQCTLIGKVAANTPSVEFIDSSIAPITSEAASIAAGGTLTFLRSELQTSAGAANVLTGDGNVVHDGLTFGGAGTQPWVTTLTVTQREGLPREQFTDVIVGATTLSSQKVVSVVGPLTVTLPPLSERAGPIFVKEHATSTGAVTVAGNGAETIRVGSAAAANTIQVPRPNNLSSGGVFLIANVVSGYWEAFFVGGQGAPCVTAYTVSPTAGAAHYTSIQSAYNAAKADGHDESSPAKVLVCPGIYTEDIGMDQAGIDIIAIAQDPYNELRGIASEGITRLDGNLSIDLDTAPPSIQNNTCAWRGIDIRVVTGAPREALIFGGTDPQRAYISDCRIVSHPARVAILGSNSGSGSVLDLVRCGVIQSQGANGAPPTIIDWNDGTIELTDCRVFGDAFGLLADVELGAEFFATGCVLIGDWDTAGDVVCRHCQITGDVTISNAAGTFEITSCEMDTVGGGGQLVTGSGGFIYDRLPWTGGTQGTFNTPASGLTTTQLESIPDGAHYDLLTQSSSYEITTESSVVMSTDGAGGTVTLPPATARTGPIRIKEIGSAAVGLVADPNGTDTINRGGAGVGVVVPTTGLTFVSDGTSNWETFD